MVTQREKYPARPLARLSLLLILPLLGSPGGMIAREAIPVVNVQEREAAARAREIGFGDMEIDNLHGSIAARLTTLRSLGGIPLQEGSYRDFMHGKDEEGREYFRFRFREGTSYSVEEFPVNYIFRSHCYLYPDGEGKGLSRVIFQFYRINFTGLNYSRELRRIIHPDPRDVAGGDITGKEIKLLDNSEITLEFYEEPSTVKPEWEGPDGVPLPNPKIEPRQRVKLNNKENPIPYEKQVRIISRYKKLLRRIDLRIYDMIRERELERRIRIERILDFPG